MIRQFGIAALIGAMSSSAACGRPADSSKTTSTTSATPSPQNATVAQPDEYGVTLMFDGGYAFIRDDVAKTLTVAAFDSPHDSGPMATAHTMKLRLDKGVPVAAPENLPISLPVPKTWDLSGKKYDIAFPSYGSTPAGVEEPPLGQLSGTDPCNQDQKNSLVRMPEMNSLAAKGGFDGSINLDRNLYQNRVLLTHGTMSIEDLTSCLEFRNDSQAIFKHRVPNGLGGIRVNFKMQANLKLTLTSLDGTVAAMEFGPDKDALGRRRLVLWFGRFPPPCAQNDPGCSYAKGQELTDFARFYSLLAKQPSAQTRVMPINASERDEVCPGSQCPSVYVRLKSK